MLALMCGGRQCILLGHVNLLSAVTIHVHPEAWLIGQGIVWEHDVITAGRPAFVVFAFASPRHDHAVGYPVADDRAGARCTDCQDIHQTRTPRIDFISGLDDG